jgi:hypothetical protein
MIKKWMRRRGFKTDKTVVLKNYPGVLFNDWQPMDKDHNIIIERISFKINLKP